MKKLTLVLSSMLLSILVFAQVPEGFNYQAVVRDVAGQEITNTTVGIQISLLQYAADGSAVYVERFIPTTNNFGLLNLIIGAGDVQNGVFADIDWGAGPYFLKVEMDETGGTSFIEIGTSQLLTVPYAFVAQDAFNLAGSDGMGEGSGLNADLLDGLDSSELLDNTDEQNLSDVLTEGSDADNNEIENVSKIGIGTLAPKAQLHLKSIEDVEIFLEADTNNITEGDNPIIKISQDNGLTVGGWGFDANNQMFLTSYSTTPHGLYISTDSIVRFAIDSSGIIDVKNNNITNLAEPVNDQDAATKAYVDKLENQINILAHYSGLNDIMLDLGKGTIMDVEENLYKTIKIGDQIWMAENLKTTKYKDGTAIPLVTDKTEWSTIQSPGYCWYNNDQATYGDTYGALYNWFTVNTGNLCPDGWHVPADTEWTTLSDYLGGYSVAGGKLKETGTTHWVSPNTGATNESGFTGLPGGYRSITETQFSNDDYFCIVGFNGYWWSSTHYYAEESHYRALFYNYAFIDINESSKRLGFSVRCLMD